jgi:hypothetical protein
MALSYLPLWIAGFPVSLSYAAFPIPEAAAIIGPIWWFLLPPWSHGYQFRNMTSLRSKNPWILSTALSWSVPMSIFLCAMLWKYGRLTIESALVVILIAIAAGFAFAMFFCESLSKRYSLSKDE